MTAVRLHVWRCALRLRQCIHFARMRFFYGAALRDPAHFVARHRQVHAPCEVETGNGHGKTVLYGDVGERVTAGSNQFALQELWRSTRADFDAVQGIKPYRKAYLSDVMQYLEKVDVEWKHSHRGMGFASIRP